MLTLKLGSTFIDTKDIEIPVVLKSPLFFNDDGEIPGSFLFNFTAPYTDDLKKELSFAHRSARSEKPEWEHSFLLHFGPISYAGVATVSELNKNEIEISVSIESGSLAALLGETKLSELPFDDPIPWDPQITFADVTQIDSLSDSNSVVFVRDLFIKPNNVRIDNLNGWNLADGTFTVPQTGNLSVNVILNSTFVIADYLGSETPMVGHRSFRIYKNGALLAYVNVDLPDDPQVSNNSFHYSNIFSLAAGDVLSFSLYASSRFIYPLHTLYVTVNPGSSVCIDDGSHPFITEPASSFPASDFAIFPFRNIKALENLPDSLFAVDTNDLKDHLPRFAPVVNYFRNGSFPYVVHGVDSFSGIYYSLLNLFSPSPYIAFIVARIFEHFGYHLESNIFASSALNRLCLLSNNVINNYFPTDLPPVIGDFIPDVSVKSFFADLCKTLGIGFSVNSANRTISFASICDIIPDHSSIVLESPVKDDPRLVSENLTGFSLSYVSLACDHISKNYKDFSDLRILGVALTPEYLPAFGEVNDCYFISSFKYYTIWNYDVDEGIYKWIFYSIDHANRVIDNHESNNPLKLELPMPIPSMYFYDPEFNPPPGSVELPYLIPAMDTTIGQSLGRFWLIPAFNVNSNFSALPESLRSDPVFSLLFYHGLYTDDLHTPYPFASNGSKDYWGTPIPSNTFALRPDGDSGLYEKRWSHFIQWRLNSPGSFHFNINLTALELAKLNWFRWYKILGVDYLLKEVRFNISNDYISLSEVIAYKR